MLVQYFISSMLLLRIQSIGIRTCQLPDIFFDSLESRLGKEVSQEALIFFLEFQAHETEEDKLSNLSLISRFLDCFD